MNAHEYPCARASSTAVLIERSGIRPRHDGVAEGLESVNITLILGRGFVGLEAAGQFVGVVDAR